MTKHTHPSPNSVSSEPTKKSTSVVSPSRIKNNYFIPLIVVFCLPVLLYLQTLRFDFTNFDDDFMIQNQLSFLQDFHNIANAFVTDQFISKTSSFYRPLGTVSYMFDIQLSGGNNPWMYHLTNILLWGIIACLLYLLIRRFSISSSVALFTTLIYCMHPLFVSTVAHMPNRAELLLILFSFLSFIFLISFFQHRKRIFLILHWIAFSLALFSKETAAFLPFIFIVYYITYVQKKNFIKKDVFILLFYFISGILWFVLRTIALKGTPTLQHTFGITPFLINLRTIPESLTLLFIPIGISPIPAFSIIRTLIGTFILFLLFYFIFKHKPSLKKKGVFCLLWFFILMIPSMLFKHPEFDYLNHRFFLPLTGILLFLLFLFADKGLIIEKRTYLWLGWVMIILLSAITFINSRAYANPMTFYTEAIAQNPDCALAYNNRGVLYEHQEQLDNAIADYSKAIERKPDNSKAAYNRGVLYARKGLYSQAIEDYTRAIMFKTDYMEAYLNRGNLFGQQNEYNKAIADYSKAIELKPSFAMAYNNRGTIYSKMGKADKAIEDFTKAIALDSNYAEAYHNRGMVYGNIGLYNNAIHDFSKAIAIKPFDVTDYEYRAVVYKAMGLYDKAVEDSLKVSDIKPLTKK